VPSSTTWADLEKAAGEGELENPWQVLIFFFITLKPRVE